KSSDTISSSFSLANFDGFLFLHKILIWVIRCQNFYLIFLSFFQSRRKIKNFEMDERMDTLSSHQHCFKWKGGLEQSIDGVEMVIGKLRIFCNSGREKVNECLDLDELSVLFDEKEPSLEEVKEAFCVLMRKKIGNSPKKNKKNWEPSFLCVSSLSSIFGLRT
ncbi:uncharacterized protein LOC143885764, partial [Tasmannia lanceolata]|uniref:uncharacterized protein LOC143885764 n=1 Tax=Tasmannia lanceolata TaxID=3420 RepID=UPI004064656C